jgi:hypothetical protein
VTTPIVEADAFTASVLAVDDGDDMAATALNPAPQALANRTRYLYNRRATGGIASYFPAPFGGVYPTANVGQSDSTVGPVVIAVRAGDTLIVTASTGLEPYSAYPGGYSVRHSIEINGVEYAAQSAVASGTSGMPLSLSCGYTAAADGTVSVVERFAFLSGGLTWRNPAHLTVIKVAV